MQPRNKSSKYVNGEQGTAMRPNSSRLVSAVGELNRVSARYEALEKAAMRVFLARGCGCCVDHDEQSEADAELGQAVGADQYADNSGYDLYKVAYRVLGRPDPQVELLRNENF